MRTIFLLGPDQWDNGVTVQWPAWASEKQGEEFTPKHFRLELAAHIDAESEGTVRAVVMDDSLRPKDQPEMGNDELFRFIETTYAVDEYFIIVPADSKVLGTIFEGGMLVRDFHHGQRPKISLFLDERFAVVDDSGGVTFSPGKRTQYLRDLLKRAHNVLYWNCLEDVLDLVAEQATA